MLNKKKLSEKQRQELQEQNASRQMKALRYLEKWSRNDVGEKLTELYSKDSERAMKTAWAIEMQERYLKTLKEDTIKTNFGTIPENVLKIVRIGSANSNRQNMFTEFPLETTDDAIYYLNYTYMDTLAGASAGDRIIENVNPYYGTEMRRVSLGTGNASTQTFTATLASRPVVPFKVLILQDKKVVATDDGSGNIIGTGITGTINYAVGSGALSVTFGTAPATGSALEVEYHYDSEVQSAYGNIGKVDISIEKRRFRARPFPLGYSFTRLVEAMLGTQGFGDADNILINGVGIEHARRKDFLSIDVAHRTALQNEVRTFDADFGNAGEVSDKSHAQRLLTTIDDISGEVGDELGRGGLNKIIAGRSAITYIRKHDLFKPDNSQPRVTGTYLAGTLGDYEVYVQSQNRSNQALIGKDEMLLTYKNPEVEGDVSIAFGVLTEFSDQLVYPQHRIDGQISSVEDYIVFEERMIRKLKIDNITL